MVGLTAAVTISAFDEGPSKVRIEFFSEQAARAFRRTSHEGVIATHGVTCETADAALVAAATAKAACGALGIPVRGHAPGVADL